MNIKFLILICSVIIISCDNNKGNSDATIANTNDSIVLNNESDQLNSANIKDLYNKQRLKKVQKFAFTNKSGFTYKGKGGTVLVFPPNVFDCNAGDSIKMDICEFADLTSIVQANLSTFSNGKMLESNGMVYCKAYSNNKEVELKKGKFFKCMFDKPKTSGFKLFEGEEANSIINWKNPISEVATKTNKVNTIKIAKAENLKKEALNICTYGTPDDVSDAEHALTFSKDSLTHIVSYFFDNYDIPYNDLIPFAPNESIILNFILTKNGRLVFKDSDSPINPKNRNKIIGYFEKMPQLNGYLNPSTGMMEDLPIYIAICPNKLLNDRLESDQMNMSKVNQIIAEKDALEKERQLEIERKDREAQAKAALEYEQLAKNRDKFEKINESMKIVFNASKMGWINCDRFYNDRRQKVDMNFIMQEQFTEYNIQIIFPVIKSVYALSISSAYNLPINEPVKIVFVGIKNSETYVFNKSVITAMENEITIEPLKIKETDLSAYVEKSLK